MPDASSYRQHDLFPDTDGKGPVVRLLEERLSPVGFSKLRRLGAWLDKLIIQQDEKDEIRYEYFRLKRNGVKPKQCAEVIMEKYNLEYDALDAIIYPRISN